MKKYLFILGSLSLFALAPHVFAADGNFVALTNIPGLTNGDVANSAGLASFLNNLYKYLIGIAAILAVVEIIWGGLEISTQDSVSKHSHGKERIQEAILGLVLVLSPALVFSIINPNIINLSLNLPPLDIHTTANTATNGTGGTGPADPVSGCLSVVGTKDILQVIKCPSMEEVNKWENNCDRTRNDWNVGFLVSNQDSRGVRSATVTAVCARKQKFTFIHGTGGLSDIAELQPLASAPAVGGIPADPNNASSAIQFARICEGADDHKTCISDAPSATFETPCGLSGPSAATEWKCYRERLTCEEVAYANPLWDAVVSPVRFNYCDNHISRTWTPFQ